MGDKFKGWLYGWLGQRKVTPEYTVRSIGTKLKPRFESKLKIKGYDYVTVGTAQTKKEAQLSAAIQFLYYLKENQDLDESELPEPLPAISFPGSSSSVSIRDDVSEYSEYSTYSDKSYDTVKTEDEDLAKYGFWTLKNAKSGVNQFMQQKRIDQDYRYSCVDDNETRYFVAELEIRIGETVIRGKGEGGSKQDASRECALYIIRRLYRSGQIDAYKDPLAQENAKEYIPLYEVSLTSSLEENMEKVIDKLNLEVAKMPKNIESVSLISSDDCYKNRIGTGKFEKDTLVSWLPPIPKLNPWSQNSACSDNALSAHILEANQMLPISDSKEIITYATQHNSVIIIRGGPGTGKSTQVPQYILDSYIKKKRGKQCNIMVVQPHDINAVLAAETVAKEREERIGETCGYITSYEIALPRTYQAITYCTAGPLLQHLEKGLNGVSHIIIDEIHERNLYTDVLLAILRDMSNVYPKLHVILMTATIDARPFSVYFTNCPVVEVVCRSYPVHEYFLEDCIEFLNYTPSEMITKKKEKNKFVFLDENSENMNKVIGPEYAETTRISMASLNEMEVPCELIEALLIYIHNLNIAGSVLVFLPGLHSVFTFLLQMKSNPAFDAKSFVFYPLHQLMSSADLQKASEPVPKGITKVILTTSVAETCVSISDVVFVINSCKTKIELSQAGRKIYASVWITKASVEQRQERAGLIRPGFCFHLCSRARYQNLRSNRIQIQIVAIHAVSLKLRLLGKSDVRGFYSKLLDPPSEEAITQAEDLLMELGTLDENRQLTSIGKILAHLPVDPRLGKMIIMGCLFGLGDAMCTIAAQSCTFTDPFTSVDAKKKYGYHQYGDHIALLRIFQDWEKVVSLEEDEKAFCTKNQLVHLSVCSIWLVKEQLKKSLRFAGLAEESITPKVMSFDSPDSNLDLVVALMCIGFYPNICLHKEKRLVLTSDRVLAQIHAFSVNCSYQSVRFPFPFLVYGEQVATFSLNCKHTTMVTPVHILLFGCKTVEYSNGIFLVDGVWQLHLSFETAAMLIALRKALGELLTYYVSETAKVEALRSDMEAMMLFESSLFEGNVSMDQKERSLIDLVKQVCARHLVSSISREPRNRSRKLGVVFCEIVTANSKMHKPWNYCPIPVRWDRSSCSGTSYH